ncbi:MAG: DNA polymerase IV [Verrucomicrobiota bacterium]
MTETRTILHLDMDAFFASVEQLDRPELRGRPVIVGSPPDARGVVATCSYEARLFGIHSAMPSRTAGRLCPHGAFVRPRMERYREISRQVFDILRSVSPLVEPVSIDEAFVDCSGRNDMPERVEPLARELKASIRNRLRLTASVGAATNKFLAKIASDLDKPDGLTVVPRSEEAIRAFLAPLPIGRMWGVGPKTEAKLAQWHIRTIGDLQQRSRRELIAILGPNTGEALAELALGHDERPVAPDSEEKSISNETTFPQDVTDWTEVERTVAALAGKVGRRLRESGKSARTVRLKIRWAGFETLTRQQSLPRFTDSDADVLAAARKLLHAVRRSSPVRLVGVGVENFSKENRHYQAELPLFPAENQLRLEQRRLDKALDDIRRRFGDASIRRGL